VPALADHLVSYDHEALMLTQNTSDQQQVLLIEHRRRLAVLLQQSVRLGDYAPPHVRIEIEDIQAAISECKAHLRTAGISIADEPNDAIELNFRTSLTQLTPQEQRNRSRMIQKVHDYWIRGVLEHSLFHAMFMDVALVQASDTVIHPWNALVQYPSAPSHPHVFHTDIANVFDDVGGALLLLGAPGAGKTILLLELARTLLNRSKQDADHPIPVVFNLASWAKDHQALREWLITELNERYDVPRQLGTTWIDDDQLLLLLDGLDEVDAEHRVACVEAINRFRHEHGLVSLVVCSRTADYTVLATKLRLQGAVVIQPLSDEQIDAYLLAAGDQLTSLRTALTNDTELRELAQSPLMLTIMALAYQHAASEALPAPGALEERRQRIFATYVDRMFKRRHIDTRYTPQQTLAWLAWLARGMQRQAQARFYLEHLQTSWLPTARHRTQYATLDRMVTGLIGSACFGISGVLFSERVGGLPNGVLLGLIGAGVGGVALGLGGGLDHKRTIAGMEIWARSRSAIVAALMCGSVFLIAYGLLYSPWLGIVFGLLFSLGSGFLFNIVGELSFRPRAVTVIETLRWSIKGVLPVALIGSLMWGIIGTLFLVVVHILGYPGATIGVSGVLGASVLGGLAGVLIGGMRQAHIEVKSRPNEGIWRSARSALFSAFTFAVCASIGAGLVFSALYGGQRGLVLGGIFGVNAGLVFGLILGGYACLSHLVLRLILYQSGYIPWNYARFLDSCVERIFLRRVGGSYIFAHRLLMEYFATLDGPARTEADNQATAKSQQTATQAALRNLR
jgi:hypothetical protein